MTSRSKKILQWAQERTADLIEARRGDDPQVIENCKSIAAVCSILLDRKTPRKPTVPTIAETGGLHNPDFIAVSTIYNQYADVVRVWREAYHQIMNTTVEEGLGLEELLVRDLDLSDLDEGTAARVQHICARSLELLQRYNALKEIVTKNVPVELDEAPELDDDLLDALRQWLERVPSWGFDYDDYGLQVSRATSAGTLIMDAELFEGLKILVGRTRSNAIALAALGKSEFN
ncbi:hypothetical protein [Rhizobium rhizogenes]|uniref:hypothetical protein n=1 Tax=Rhizobium rhizogenes TaxID=359 RepID=UPI001572F221|nr:hypothetical protein [Rhizobium rhizogenes]NTG08834.1 hypothetical protein [Rhizobium rhizogenes]